MNHVFIYDHVRTPRGRGRADGGLHTVPPVHLAATVLRALRERNDFAVDDIEDVGLGIVMPVGEQGADLTRSALLLAGYGDGVSGHQLNRFCTSGLDTVKMGFGLVASGQAEAAIGGGVESMSRVPIGSDGGAAYTDPQLTQRFPYVPNGVCADLMATLLGLERADLDAYAQESQQRAGAARAEGRFDRSLVPVHDRFGQCLLAQDEAPRPAITLADLAKLPVSFAAVGEQGFSAIVLRQYAHLEAVRPLHTAGTSSGIVDGACAVLLGSQAFGVKHGLRPRARIVAAATCASEPLLSLGGPIPVTGKVLQRAGLRIDDIDLFEVNEAFATVPLGYMRHYGIPRDRINTNGGAIALGHPLGATGAMLLGTALDELERRSATRALITLCAAGGQATAIVIERF